MIKEVVFSSKVEKNIVSLPLFIKRKLMTWIDDVEEQGLEEVRKIIGYHDEPLKGKWIGYRSIRLNRAYRAIYIIKENDFVEFVSIEEVNKHDY